MLKRILFKVPWGIKTQKLSSCKNSKSSERVKWNNLDQELKASEKSDASDQF